MSFVHGVVAHFAFDPPQWQDLILSVEADYTHTSLSVTVRSSEIIARSFTPPAGNVVSVTINNGKGHF